MTTLQTAWLTFCGLVVAALIGGFFGLATKWMDVAQSRVTENNKLADSIRDDLDKERTALKDEVKKLKEEVHELRTDLAQMRSDIANHETVRATAEREAMRLAEELRLAREEIAGLRTDKESLTASLNVALRGQEVFEVVDRERRRIKEEGEGN